MLWLRGIPLGIGHSGLPHASNLSICQTSPQSCCAICSSAGHIKKLCCVTCAEDAGPDALISQSLAEPICIIASLSQSPVSKVVFLPNTPVRAPVKPSVMTQQISSAQTSRFAKPLGCWLSSGTACQTPWTPGQTTQPRSGGFGGR